MRTLFNLGFRIEEQLETRISILKAMEASPQPAIPLQWLTGAPFYPDALTKLLESLPPRPRYTAVLGGRELAGAELHRPLTLARQLAAALLPLAERYPMPFARASA